MIIAAVPVLMYIPPVLDKNSLSSASSPASVAIHFLNNSRPEGRRRDLLDGYDIRFLYVYWPFVLYFVRTICLFHISIIY